MSTPTVKVTLQHLSGAISNYKPGTSSNIAEHGGLREAIVTCFATHGNPNTRVELLRSDIPGADWSAMDRAGAYADLLARLQRSAIDLLDGHDPCVVVTLNDKRALVDAHLVTNQAEADLELQDQNKRSLVVPRILPYQLGGSAEGASAVIYSPTAGGGLRLHSIHPTAAEAAIAEANLKAAGETKTGQLKVHTSVTTLLAAVANGTFKPAPMNLDGDEPLTNSGPVSRAHPGLMPSPLAAPTPFAK